MAAQYYFRSYEGPIYLLAFIFSANGCMGTVMETRECVMAFSIQPSEVIALVNVVSANLCIERV